VAVVTSEQSSGLGEEKELGLGGKSTAFWGHEGDVRGVEGYQEEPYVERGVSENLLDPKAGRKSRCLVREKLLRLTPGRFRFATFFTG